MDVPHVETSRVNGTEIASSVKCDSRKLYRVDGMRAGRLCARTFNTTADVYDDGCAGARGTNPRQLYLVGTVEGQRYEMSSRVYDGDGASGTVTCKSDHMGWYM